MKREEIARTVIAVTARELGKEIDQIQEDHHFAFDLGADSLKSIELVAGFEEEFDLDLNEEEALKVQTVGAAIEFFANLLPE